MKEDQKMTIGFREELMDERKSNDILDIGVLATLFASCELVWHSSSSPLLLGQGPKYDHHHPK
jgi:hypothetical protein